MTWLVFILDCVDASWSFWVPDTMRLQAKPTGGCILLPMSWSNPQLLLLLRHKLRTGSFSPQTTLWSLHVPLHGLRGYFENEYQSMCWGSRI